jgi:hypothetical protein
MNFNWTRFYEWLFVWILAISALGETGRYKIPCGIIILGFMMHGKNEKINEQTKNR